MKNQKKKRRSSFAVFLIVALLIGLCIGGGFLTLRFYGKLFGFWKPAKPDITNYHTAVELTDELIAGSPAESSLSLVETSFTEDGDFRHLSGDFDDKVTSSEEALHFLAKHADLIGLKDAEASLRFDQEYTHNGVTCYKFQRVWQDIPVMGNQLIVTANADGVPQSVSGCYTPFELEGEISHDPAKAEKTAKQIAGNNAEILSCDLAVMPRTEQGDARLVYDIRVYGSKKAVELYLDADTCEVLSESDLLEKALKTVTLEANGHQYTLDAIDIPLERSYKLIDTSRNIQVCDGSKYSYAFITFVADKFTDHDPLTAEVLSENSDGSKTVKMSTVRSLTGEYIELPDPLYAEMAISSLSSTQKAYDFYKTKFNWISFDNKGMTLHLVVGTNKIVGNLDDEDLKNLLDVMLKLSHEYYTNNGYISGSSIVLFGEIGGRSLAQPGITCHEFTHGVFYNITHADGSKSTKMINEGYADVMASLSTGDWEFLANELPEDYEYRDYYSRSAIDPHKFWTPAIRNSSDEYYEEVPADPHSNATLLSHAAYLMSQRDITNDELGDLFFGSMFKLSSHPDYNEVSRALLDTANADESLQKHATQIAAVLIQNGLLDPTPRQITVTVHCGNRVIPNAVITIDGSNVGKTNEHGVLILEDQEFLGETIITANANGFNSLSKAVFILDDDIKMDFDLAVNRSFGKENGSDKNKKGNVKGDKVTVTIVGMFADRDSKKAKESAQEFYVKKGSSIDLELLVNALKLKFIKTDGTRIYIDTGHVPIELVYYIYGSDEVFDFSQPIYENVVIEPKVGVDGLDFGGQELSELLKMLDKNYDGHNLNDVADELDHLFNGDGLKDFADEFYKIFDE